MADDVKVTIGAVSSGATSEFKRVGQQIESLRQSGKKLGGVLEGDRRVEAKMTSWVQGFANARNGADLLANTLGNLGDVFKTSLAIGVGLNVGGALLSSLSNAIAKTAELKKAADEAAASLRAAFSSGDQGQLSSAIANATANIEKLKASLTDRWFTGTTGEREEKNRLAELEKERSMAVGGLMEAKALQVSINELRRLGMDETADKMQEQIKLAKEVADIEALKLPANERNAAVAMAQVESEARLRDAANARNEKAHEEIAKLIEKEAEQEAAKGAITSKALADEQKQREDLQAFEQRQKNQFFDEERKDAEELIEFEKKQKEDFFKWEREQKDKQHAADKKATEEKLNLERKHRNEQLKWAEGQKSSALEAGQQAAQGVASGVSLPTQRWYEQAQRTNDARVAGVVARDAARRKFGNDADVMASKKVKDWIKDTKEALMPEKKGDVGDLTSAINNVALIKTAIQNLEKKLGIK